MPIPDVGTKADDHGHEAQDGTDAYGNTEWIGPLQVLDGFHDAGGLVGIGAFSVSAGTTGFRVHCRANAARWIGRRQIIILSSYISVSHDN